MNYLTKIIFVCTLFLISSVYSSTKNQIIFILDDNIYTTIDLDRRTKYLELFNKTKISNNKLILDDLINVSLYNKYFHDKNKKLPKNSIENFFKEIFKQYETNNNEDYFSEIYTKLPKDIILENIKFDLQKKNIIEEELNKQKDIIFKKNTNELKLLYNFHIDYFLIEKKIIKRLKKIINEINFNEINIKLKEIQSQNIDIKHEIKKIKDIDNLDQKLKKFIISNKEFFYFDNHSNVFIGKIIKKLKNEDKIDLLLYQIVTKKEIPEETIQCKNIENLKKNHEYKITNMEINYKKINDNLKLKLNTVDDFAKFKNKKDLIYIILCQLKFDKQIYEQININENINNLVNEIDTEFIRINKKKYNLEIINE